MPTSSEYIVPYLGISDGEHKFAFDIAQDFWKNFETSKISEGEMKVDVIFDKLGRLVTLYISCEGHFLADCDRCTTSIAIPIHFDDRIVIKLEEESSNNEDVVFMDPKTSHIDLSPLIYESIHVHLPLLNLKDCESEGYKECDQEVLGRLNSFDDEPEETSKSGIWSELNKLNLN